MIILLVVFFFYLTVTSCSSSNDQETEKLRKEIAELKKENSKKDETLKPSVSPEATASAKPESTTKKKAEAAVPKFEDFAEDEMYSGDNYPLVLDDFSKACCTLILP